MLDFSKLDIGLINLILFSYRPEDADNTKHEIDFGEVLSRLAHPLEKVDKVSYRLVNYLVSFEGKWLKFILILN